MRGVLLVVSDELLAAGYRSPLSGRYRVHHAASGGRALASFPELRGVLHAVLVHDDLPDLTALDVALKLRELADVRVVLVTTKLSSAQPERPHASSRRKVTRGHRRSP